MKWSATVFEALYEDIACGKFDEKLFSGLLPDLQNLNLNTGKLKNSNSRSLLEQGEIKLENGNIYKINQEFMIAAVTLADELNLDELVVCELILSDPSTASGENDEGLSLVNAGKVQYYLRRQYILQIVAYIINCINTNKSIYKNLTSNGTLASNILNAFISIHTQLADIKQQVNRAQILDSYHALLQQNVKFKRDFLLTEYDILSQILFGLVNKGILMQKNHLINIINHVSEMESKDFFIIYYLPAIFNAFSNMNKLPDSDVRSLHEQFLHELKSDSLYTKPIKVSLIFVFLSYFINWCKVEPIKRANTMDFTITVDEPMTKTVELGALEQLLIFAADTSIVERDKSMDLYYDIRSLLERHIPRLIPVQLLDNQPDFQQQQQQQQPTSNIHAGTYSNNLTGLQNKQGKEFLSVVLSEHTELFFLSTFHEVLRTVIADCAFLLTKIKDAEEDSLLSGEDLDLDDIALKADLERFFLTVYYFYASRPEYSKLFWQDKESNSYGFIEWSAKCNDSLMRSCFYLMISSLSYGSENSLSVYHYFGADNNVSWNILCQCISDFVLKISNLNTKVQQRQQKQESDEIDSTAVALEEGLNEESIIFISSLFTLIGSVANDVDEQIKGSLSKLFTDVLFEFAKLETPLIGACLKTISHLVPKLESSRSNFWYSLDSLIFKGAPLTSMTESYRAAFTSVLTNFSEVVGFLQLFKRLLSIESKESNSDYIRFGTLAFPINMGQGYRKAGIWPYFDYIFHEVLVHSNQLNDPLKTRTIQLPILQTLEEALFSFDYSILLNSIPAGANFDKLVETKNFFAYVQECPSTAVFNYLFTEKVYKCIFDIASIGVDHISIDLDGGLEQLQIIRSSVKIISTLLEFQETYVEEFVSIVLKHGKSNYFMPKDFGLHGLRSFYDAIFFNLPVIAHLGLYVGLNDDMLASNSLKILKKLSLRYSNDHSQFNAKNKLLTIFDSVDESARIKDAFISQVERRIDCTEALNLKLQLLEFIDTNLSATDQNPTVAHLLLGFQVSNTVSIGPALSTFINSDTSLLNSLLALLESSLHSVSSDKVDYAPIRLAAITLGIILKLSRNPITSNLVLDHFATLQLFEKLMELDPQVHEHTLWNGRQFDSKLDEDCKKFIQCESNGALLSFLSYRSHVLQYFSLSVHRLSLRGRKSQIESHVDLLISNTLYSAKIFSFLDTLHYGDMPSDYESIKKLSLFNKLPLNLETVTIKNDCSGNIYDFSEIESLLDLSWKVQATTSLGHSTSDDLTLPERAKHERQVIRECITGLLSRKTFIDSQLSILHSWVQLVQIIVSDGELSPLTRSNFILEVFGSIVPKINDYIEFDISFSEELVSLAVVLYDVYQRDRISIDNYQTVDTRLYNLFNASIHGINSPLSSFSIRSDFYVLANSYLVKILKDVKMAKQILRDLRMNSEMLVEVICNDTIYGQGTNRITSIFLLDSLIQLGGLNKENLILSSLMRNTQLLLIIRSIKNTDTLLNSPSENISIDDFLYELTAFKTVIHLLIRIAETRNGAKALVQNKLFPVIADCSFLQLDPDLGLELIFDELSIKNSNFIRVNVTLDNPLFLGKGANGISLFEIIVPVFQLIAAVLLSMGSSNLTVIQEVKKLLMKFRKLSLGIMKRDALNDTNGKHNLADSSHQGLKEMVKLIVMLCTLTSYHGEEKS